MRRMSFKRRFSRGRRRGGVSFRRRGSVGRRRVLRRAIGYRR